MVGLLDFILATADMHARATHLFVICSEFVSPFSQNSHKIYKNADTVQKKIGKLFKKIETYKNRKL